jgi:hypothetical protein
MAVTELTVATRASLIVASLLLLVVATPAVVVPGRTADWFGWTAASPLAANVTGALLWAIAACAAIAALAPRWVDARIVIAPLAATGIASLVATLLEGDARHDDWTGLLWLTVLAVLPLVAVAVVLMQRDDIADEVRDDVHSPAFSLSIAAQAALLLGTGLVALIDPERGARVWPWPSSAMDARVVGALAIALGAVAAAATFEGEPRRVRSLGVGFGVAVVLLGVGVGRDLDALDWSRPMTYVVVAFVASLAATAAWALIAGPSAHAERDAFVLPPLEPTDAAEPIDAPVPVAPSATKGKEPPKPPDEPKPPKEKKRKQADGMEKRQMKRQLIAGLRNSLYGGLKR